MVHVTTPLSGMVCYRPTWASTCYRANLPTKFEAFNSTHYEDMTADTKCRKWGGLG